MNVFIRPLKIEDAYTSVMWRNDKEVFKYTGNTYDHEITIDSELNWIKKVIANANEYRCAIIADDKYIGNIYLTDISEGEAHYHIFIGDRSYWGKGIAKKASTLILKYGFEELGLSKIVLRVNKNNCVARQLYKNLGFVDISDDGTFVTMELTKR